MSSSHWFRRPRPPGTASMPQTSTSHAGSHMPLFSFSSTPRERPAQVRQPASTAGRIQQGHLEDNVLGLTITVAGVAEQVASGTNVPGLALGFSALVDVLKKIQTMSATVKGVGALKQDVNDLVKAATGFSARNPGGKLPEGLQNTINELTSKWMEIGENATKLASRNRVKRFFGSASDAKKLESLVVEISSSIQRALIRGGWDIQLAVGEMQRKLDAIADQQDGERMLPYADSAAYDAVSARPREPCLDGTREGILGDVWTWVKLPARDLAPIHDTQGSDGALMSTEDALGFIYWICGLAGTGKTSIACSISEQCKNEGILGASFFFSRFDSKCDNSRLLFTTISHQLCRVHAEYKANVAAALKLNPDIVNSLPAVQFEKLILEPLEQLTEPFPRLAIVIDALDECRGDDSTSTLFHILSRFKERVARFFLFIMTSRPEPEIVTYFDQTHPGQLGKATKQLILHTVELEPILQDIGRFLTYHLKDRLGRRVPQGRPSDEDIAALCNVSNGLFIFARTAVNLITDKRSMDPVATLERIVQRQSSRSNSVSILDELYRQVLEEAHPDAEEELQEPIRQIVGTLAVAAEPLSVTTLAALLGFEVHVVQNVLSGLYSVLDIPDENSQLIHFIHPTFPEFLLQVSPAPSLPSRFSVEATKQHTAVFIRCLTITKTLLRYDIADLEDPCTFKKDVPGLLDRVQQHIPSHLSYACRNWAMHFRLGSGVPAPTTLLKSSDSLLHQHLSHWNWATHLRRRSRTSVPTTLYALFSEFLHQNLLYWLEACSLLDTLGDTPAALDTARHTCQSLGKPFSKLVPLLLDVRRFTLTYAPCINTAPLQAYHSALALTLQGGLVLRTYLDARRKESLAVCRGAPHEWAPCLDSFVGNGGKPVKAVAFSPDNTYFVSGGDDGMLKVWQASTRTLVLGIQAFNDWVRAVAYSPDGLHIAAGSEEGLSIWHAASGAQVRVITTDDIREVAYTADGSHVLSVSNDGKVQLWRVSDGVALASLDGDGWKQADISSDGPLIAYTRGASLLLHDISSGKHESLELSGEGKAAIFSSDGRYVAAATDRAIRIWSCRDKSLVRSIDLPAGHYTRLSFSPDGSRICRGGGAGSVYIWHVANSGGARKLQGHTDWVWDVAWSPDGSQIISASDDGTIRLWDVATHLPAKQLNPSSDRPSSGASRALVAKCQGHFTILDLPPHSITDLSPEGEDGFTILDFPSHPIADLFLPPRGGSAANDAPALTLHPDRAAAWDHVTHSTRVRHPEMSYRWAALTGQNEFSSGATTAISNDGSLIAYPVARNICIRSLTTGEVVATLTPEFESGDVHSIVFSPDNSHLASGSQSSAAVAVWDVAAGACVAYHHHHSDWIRCVTFSSDGRLVVSGSNDRTARVFDISAQHVTCVFNTLTSPFRLRQRMAYVKQLVLTTDGRLLVAQDSGGALYIWNIETGSRIASFPLSDELWITTLRLTPTGFSVSTKDGEHTVELWKVDDRAWPIYYISRDGWMYAKGPGYTRRLAWLPPEWRHPVCSEGARLCVCEKDEMHRSKNLVELDMSRVLDHVGISYAR